MTAPDLTGVTIAGRNVQEARNILQAAMTSARREAFNALNNGASEVTVAKHLGVDRNTLRRWQGK